MYTVLVILPCLAFEQASPAVFSGRIYGGQNVSITERPFQVSIEHNIGHSCGGSIVSSRDILTAGHCIADNPNAPTYKVRVGTDVKEKSGVLYEVEYVKLHENYTSNSVVPKNDIGIIRVKKPFEFGKKIQKVQLVDSGEIVKAGAISVTSGWGATDQGPTDQLKAVSMPAYDRPLCNKIYPEVVNTVPGGVPESYICAGIYGVENKSGCYGDSGGPMTIAGRLAGIVSWGPKCGSDKHPSVFTDVAYYHEWIVKNINKA